MGNENQDYKQTLRHLEDALETVQTPGWKYLMEQWEVEIKAAENIGTIQNERDLYTRQGVLRVMYALRNLEGVMEATVKQINELLEAADNPPSEWEDEEA